MPFADVNGQHIYFEDSGDTGPAVIFSHGFLMDHEMFEPQVRAHRDEFRCVTWDERGFGQTPVTDSFTYWDSADDCLALLDHLGIGSAVLVGMSQGGFLSLRAALRAPERVKALVLIDTQAGVEAEEARPLYQGLHDQWVADGLSDEVAAVIASIILSPGYDPAPWIAKWKAIPRESLGPPFNCLMGREDLTERLGEIGSPVIVFHGEADAAIPMDLADRLCAGLPKCVGLVRIPGAGHASNLSHPEDVNGPLRAFLKTCT
jgi:pimeloyl-ACP methyl ester carboxylesterase